MQSPDISRRPAERTCSLGIALALCCSIVTAGAEAIQLRPQTNVMANGVALDLGDYSIPCVADWNGDGKLDLIVGYQPAWKVAVYTNSGTSNGPPVFTAFANIQAGGTDIYVPAGGCGSPAPWVCDYDHDGNRDLLVGEGTYGKVYFYRNTTANPTPILAAGQTLKFNGNDLSVGSRAAPYVCDWDGDGLDDLLCGDGNGNVHFFRNSGTLQNPVYTNDVWLLTGGTPPAYLFRSVVRVYDWDGDGRKDLIVSANNYLGWCKNVSSTSLPVLGPLVPLQAPTASGTLVNIATGGRMRLEVTEWWHPGVPDLLIGNYDGRVLLYPGYHFAFQNVRSQPAGQCVLEWNSADFLKYNIFAGTNVNGISNLVANAVPSGGQTTCWTNQSPDDVRFYRVGIAPQAGMVKAAAAVFQSR